MTHFSPIVYVRIFKSSKISYRLFFVATTSKKLLAFFLLSWKRIEFSAHFLLRLFACDSRSAEGTWIDVDVRMVFICKYWYTIRRYALRNCKVCVQNITRSRSNANCFTIICDVHYSSSVSLGITNETKIENYSFTHLEYVQISTGNWIESISGDIESPNKKKKRRIQNSAFFHTRHGRKIIICVRFYSIHQRDDYFLCTVIHWNNFTFLCGSQQEMSYTNHPLPR